MDAKTQHSSAIVVPNDSLENSSLALGTLCFSQFWSPNTVLDNDYFKHDKMRNFIGDAAS